MIALLARPADEVASRLREHWDDVPARLITPRDLSSAGWRWSPDGNEEDRCVVEGEVVAVSELDAVLVRLPALADADLPHVVAEDRAYVAAEINAFLLAWLDRFDGPVLNRPAASGPASPGFSVAQWVHCASRLGLPVEPICLGSALDPAHPGDRGVELVVVGGRVLGTADRLAHDVALELARGTGLGLLGVRLTDTARIVAADAWWWSASDRVARSVRDALGTRRATAGRP